jgi:hypothetical protein
MTYDSDVVRHIRVGRVLYDVVGQTYDVVGWQEATGEADSDPRSRGRSHSGWLALGVRRPAQAGPTQCRVKTPICRL